MKPRRLLLDEQLLLDVLFDREGSEDAAKLWARLELGAAEGLIAAHSVAALGEAAREARGPAFGLRVIREVLRVFRVAAVDAKVVGQALELARRDLDTALLVATAEAARCHAVVTRRKVEPELGAVASLTPDAALAALR